MVRGIGVRAMGIIRVNRVVATEEAIRRIRRDKVDNTIVNSCRRGRRRVVAFWGSCSERGRVTVGWGVGMVGGGTSSKGMVSSRGINKGMEEEVTDSSRWVTDSSQWGMVGIPSRGICSSSRRRGGPDWELVGGRRWGWVEGCWGG